MGRGQSSAARDRAFEEDEGIQRFFREKSLHCVCHSRSVRFGASSAAVNRINSSEAAAGATVVTSHCPAPIWPGCGTFTLWDLQTALAAFELHVTRVYTGSGPLHY